MDDTTSVTITTHRNPSVTLPKPGQRQIAKVRKVRVDGSSNFGEFPIPRCKVASLQCQIPPDKDYISPTSDRTGLDQPRLILLISGPDRYSSNAAAFCAGLALSHGHRCMVVDRARELVKRGGKGGGKEPGTRAL